MYRNILSQFKQLLNKARLLRNYNIDFNHFSNESKSIEKRFELRKDYPCLDDKTQYTGFDRHYVYHNAWALRKVLQIKPVKHIDISSTLYFSSSLSAIIPVEFYDYRPAEIILDNLMPAQGDLMSLPFKNDSVESLSCMHTIEHIGLGRYGDVIDYDGDIKACRELSRVVKSGGDLLVVVPVGHENVIHYNAHRVYTKDAIVSMFSDKLKMHEFTLIPEDVRDGGLIQDPPLNILNKQNYGCGCFWFKAQ